MSLSYYHSDISWKKLFIIRQSLRDLTGKFTLIEEFGISKYVSVASCNNYLAIANDNFISIFDNYKQYDIISMSETKILYFIDNVLVLSNGSFYTPHNKDLFFFPENLPFMGPYYSLCPYKYGNYFHVDYKSKIRSELNISQKMFTSSRYLILLKDYIIFPPFYSNNWSIYNLKSKGLRFQTSFLLKSYKFIFTLYQNTFYFIHEYNQLIQCQVIKDNLHFNKIDIGFKGAKIDGLKCTDDGRYLLVEQITPYHFFLLYDIISKNSLEFINIDDIEINNSSLNEIMIVKDNKVTVGMLI